MASDIAKADGIEEGLICVLKCVEPCYSMTVGPNRERKRLEIRRQFVKCAHLYFYLIDPRLGPLHLRLQTWLPFNIHVGCGLGLVRSGSPIPMFRPFGAWMRTESVPGATARLAELGLPLPRAGMLWPLRGGSDGVRYEVARLLSSLALRVGVELRGDLQAGGRCG